MSVCECVSVCVVFCSVFLVVVGCDGIFLYNFFLYKVTNVEDVHFPLASLLAFVLTFVA